MARPRQNKPPRRETSFRVTQEERDRITANAKSAGLSRNEYIRQKALSAEIVYAEKPNHFPLVHALNKIGVNLQQLIDAPHIQGPIPPEVYKLRDKIEKIATTVIDRELEGKEY